MNCNCIEKLNEYLKKKDLCLHLHQTVNMTTYETAHKLAILTVSLKKGVKPLKLFPSFCPFCGK